MKSRGFGWVFPTILLSSALFCLWAGASPGERLSEKPQRMLTPEEMRSLAGRAPCDQGSCSVATRDVDITGSYGGECYRYKRYYFSSCYVGDTGICELVQTNDVLSEVQFLDGYDPDGEQGITMYFCPQNTADDTCEGGLEVSGSRKFEHKRCKQPWE